MKAGKARQSIRRFHDYSSDLRYSDMNNFEDRLALLLEFIRTDELFTEIHNQLINNPNVDFDSWYKERKATEKGMRGSGSLIFPTITDDRLSLMYQALQKIGNKEMDVLNFSISFCASSSSRINTFVSFFNENVTEPLMREIGYKLEDIELELPMDDRQEVTAPMIQIVHHAENVINQNITGNNNNQAASITVENSELDKMFFELRQAISELELNSDEKQGHLETIQACEGLVKAEKPMLTAAKTLLFSLVPLGANVAAIATAISTYLA
ncbi:hypothetical protein AB6C85_12795 [Vibrio splendidus]